MRLTPGTRVGPYEVVLLLGRGMSEVYRATDTRLGRDVALKVLGESLGTHGPAVERFEREARLAASLSHPNVVALFDVGFHDGQPYFVTELLQGQTLRERLGQGPIPVAEALDWALQTLQGLAAVHARGIVHRDLKPENLFITDTGQVKLLDFGIAKAVEAAQQAAAPRGLMDETRAPSGTQTETGMVVGTPGYMAPEQVRGEGVDVRSDVFSLGAVLHEMLSGQRAFSGNSLVEAGYAILHGVPGPLRDGVPARLAAIVHRCLEKEPGRRFQSVPALSAALLGARAPSRSTPGIDAASGADGTAPTARSRAGAPPGRRLLPFGVLATVGLGVAALLLVRAWRADAFWRNPLAGARFQLLTDSEEAEHSGAISRDGQVVAFLSARDGPTDVWFTRVGGGVPLNATRGRIPEIGLNRQVRMMRFSPDGAFVTLWLGKSDRVKRTQVDTWAIPTLPAEPRRFLSGALEPDWSPDGKQLVYHQAGPRDAMFVQAGSDEPRQIYLAPAADKAPEHAHFQTWSPDGEFVYFVQGDIPNPRGPQDIWRIRPTGSTPERITFHATQVTHPTFLDRSTLLYLATTPDGQGPWIHGIDVDRRVPHQLGDGAAAYNSLAASADGRRLVATVAQLRTSLWRVSLDGSAGSGREVTRLKLPTTQGRWPRLGPDSLVYVSSSGGVDRLWKVTGDSPTELWTSRGAHVMAAPAFSPAGDRIALCIEDGARKRLLVMGSDGSRVRTLTDALALRGAPDWAPDGKSIVVSADEGGTPHLFRVETETARAVRVMDDYALDPVWAPGGEFLAYSGGDVGTTFPVRTVTPAGQPRPLPELVLNRGARRFRFLPGQATLVIARGDMEFKNLWARDLSTGAERQLTQFGRDVLMNDFDLSPDGRTLVFERVQESSDIVLLEREER